MKKVGFITRNKVLAQSFCAAAQAKQEASFQIFSMLDYRQAELDAQVLGIGVAIVDGNQEIGTALQLCGQLRTSVPRCRILFIVGQQSRADMEIAVAAKKAGRIDDFLFYDSSLDYLIAKLSSM